jgi:hypothetical protein
MDIVEVDGDDEKRYRPPPPLGPTAVLVVKEEDDILRVKGLDSGAFQYNAPPL